MNRVSHPLRSGRQPQGRVRVVYRFLPAASLLPFLRFGVTVALVALAIGGSARYLRGLPGASGEEAPSDVTATAPTNIQQSTNGTGLVTFETSVTNKDLKLTRMRVEYSTDNGKKWSKAALTSAKASVGSVDVNNKKQYQIGSNNDIDTETSAAVTLTVTWDTKSVNNLGGAIIGDVDTVKLRVLPRDGVTTGPYATSASFRVDNRAPLGLSNFHMVGASGTQLQLAWSPPTDSSLFSSRIYYGTDATAVGNQISDTWDASDDKGLEDVGATGTTISGLTPETRYSFKVVVKDAFGNEASSSRIAAATATSGVTLPSPTPLADGSATPSPSPVSSPVLQPTPRPVVPPTTFKNRKPAADAGSDQVVNPNALVILDGTASFDPDSDVLTFVWRQLSGPRVEMLSARTSTPSFSAGDENETYIFSLTVRDPQGASATDIVTVATKALAVGETIPVTVTSPLPTLAPVSEPDVPLAEMLLRLGDLFLFAVAAGTAAISVIDRTARQWREGGAVPSSAESAGGATGRVMHYKTGEPIVGANILVHGSDGKLKNSERANVRGEFSTLFPAGTYTIGVQAEGFGFAPTTASAMRPDQGILYTGGTLTVQDGSRPISITIPMKPTGEEVSSWRTRWLHGWQSVQRWGRALSWPAFLVGAALNTFLIFWTPTLLYLAVEALYVILVIVKVALEVRIRPAYGLVRDAITHVPLDLAVIRLYEQGTNRLVMTRVTNGQGKFFALPPAGNYIITVTKSGYAVFSKQNLAIAGDEDSALQITTDLMPVTPQAGLEAARAAVL